MFSSHGFTGDISRQQKKGLKGTAEDLVRQRSPGTMIHAWILWVIYFVKENMIQLA